MLDVLAQLEQDLPEMLKDESIWRSLYVDYHPPTVERLWTPWREYRAFLHRIHPCDRQQALFHPHPWPSAMRVLEGAYEMAVGFGAGMAEPPVAAKPAAVAFDGKVVLVSSLKTKPAGTFAAEAVALVADDGKVYPIETGDAAKKLVLDKGLHDRPMKLTATLTTTNSLKVTKVQSVVKGQLHDIDYW